MALLITYVSACLQKNTNGSSCSSWSWSFKLDVTDSAARGGGGGGNNDYLPRGTSQGRFSWSNSKDFMLKNVGAVLNTVKPKKRKCRQNVSKSFLLKQRTATQLANNKKISWFSLSTNLQLKGYWNINFFLANPWNNWPGCVNAFAKWQRTWRANCHASPGTNGP